MTQSWTSALTRKAVVLFGNDPLIGHGDAQRGKEAFTALDFYVHMETLNRLETEMQRGCPSPRYTFRREALSVIYNYVCFIRSPSWNDTPLSLLQNSSNAANFPCVRGAEGPALRPARA